MVRRNLLFFFSDITDSREYSPHNDSIARLARFVSFALSLKVLRGADTLLITTVRSITELETNLVSVERVQQYQLLPPEGLPSDKSAIGPDSTWPQHGEIEFRNVAARYRPGLDLILNDVSFKVEGGQKVCSLRPLL